MSFTYARPHVLDSADGIVGVEGFAAFEPVSLPPRVDFIFSTPPLALGTFAPMTLPPIDFDGFPVGSSAIERGAKTSAVQDSRNFLLAEPGLGFQDFQRTFFSG
jgi:hypothetical protein